MEYENVTTDYVTSQKCAFLAKTQNRNTTMAFSTRTVTRSTDSADS